MELEEHTFKSLACERFNAMELDELISGVSRYEREKGPRTEMWDIPTLRDRLKEEDTAEETKQWPVTQADGQRKVY